MLIDRAFSYRLIAISSSSLTFKSNSSFAPSIPFPPIPKREVSSFIRPAPSLPKRMKPSSATHYVNDLTSSSSIPDSPSEKKGSRLSEANNLEKVSN